MDTPEKKRIGWVDAAKGYGTFLVILGHIGFGRAHQWIYSFHLPLFFFLSGFTFSLKSNFREFLRRRAKTLLIPCLCLSLTILIFDSCRELAEGTFSFHTLPAFFLEILIQRRFLALWFIACLFMLNLIFYPIIRYTRQWQGIVISAAMAAAGLLYYSRGGQPLPWNIDVCFTAAPFFYAGYLLKCHGTTFEVLFSEKRFSLVAMAGALAINVLCWTMSDRISGSVFDMYGSLYGFPLLSYPAAFSGILFMVFFSRISDFRFPEYVGQNSLLYYAWHQKIIWPLIIPLFNLFGIYSEKLSGGVPLLIYNFAVFFVTVGFATVLNRLIVKTKLKFIVGK